jgi:hypothetical protein
MARINPGRMMLDDGGGYEPLIAVAVQAAVASPAVVNTPANVAPKAAEVEKVVTSVLKAVAPDNDRTTITELAKQVTQAVVTNPAVIASPAGQTVNTTTTQGIIAASAQPVPGIGGVVGGSSNAGAYASSGFPGSDKNPVPATTKSNVTTTFTPTGNTFTDTLNKLRAERGITPADVNASGQLDVKGLTDKRVDAAQAVAAKPVMSEAQKAGGGVVKWIGGVDGKYEIVMPTGSPLVGSKAAGWEPGRNNLAGQPAGSTTSPSTATTTPVTTTPTTTTATTTTPTTTIPTTALTTTPTTNDPTFTSPVIDPNAPLVRKLQEQIDALKKQAADTAAGTSATQYNDRTSVYATMADRFNKYGLSGLANKIKELAMQGATEATITLQLQETPEYQQRFAANADRIKKGLAALTPAEYVNVEDSYRQVLRAYGLKQFDNDAYVKQFISNDMSPTELSNRVVTAVQRVQNADPAILSQLKQYYGIGAPDMVAYVLDPEQQFQKIERQIAASEIGVAAGRQGLTAGVSVAEQLAAQGVTEAQAQKGYATIADILPTAEKLSDIYGTTLDGYRQAEGEQEVFNSLASAQRKRQKLSAREIAAFSGSSGTNKASLTTSNVGKF